MGELKQHQPPMTIDEQVENLKSIGLIVEDEEYAKRILNDITYFRLIKAYSLNLKPKNGNYVDKVTFEQLVELYLFNANFRQNIFPEIEKIEINCDVSVWHRVYDLTRPIDEICPLSLLRCEGLG